MPSRSPSPDPELQLDPSTLSILTAFLREKADEEEQFRKLAEERARVAEQQQQEQGEREGGEGDVSRVVAEQQKMMSVDEFRVRPLGRRRRAAV